MDIILISGKEPALGYSYFEANGFSRKTIENYGTRKPLSLYYEAGKTYFKWSYLSKSIQNRLGGKEVVISIAKGEHLDKITAEIADRLQYAFTKKFHQYVTIHKEKHGLNPQKAAETAQVHAVWQEIIDMDSEGIKKVRAMHQAYCNVVSTKPLTWATFNKNKGLALRHGAEWMAIDGRKDNSLPESSRISVVNQYWATALISLGHKKNNRQVWEVLCDMCQEAGEKPPSQKWVEKYRKQVLKNKDTYTSRYGQEKANTKLPYASMQKALNANTQWQMDGWVMPIWGLNRDGKGFHRYTLFVVMDAHSEKIVGFSVDESENTTMILEALKYAISETGCLPGELVADNHSWNKTQESQYFVDQLTKRKLYYTVTSNPQWKSIIERNNQNLDAECQDRPGYLGKGNRSKSDEAHPKPELIEKYRGQFLSIDEMKAHACAIVVSYNNRVKEKTGVSPNESYATSEPLKCCPLDIYERVQVLTAQRDITIRRGQLNITLAGKKYQYQLPAHLFEQYNDTTVHVRYEDLHECIYLYEMGTDKPIDCLQNKPLIHGAKPDQTEADIELLNKNKGRLVGIKTKGRKKNEELTAAALKANPEAINLLSARTIPKDVKQEAEQNAELRQVMRRQGIDPDLLHVPERQSLLDNPALRSEKVKPKRSLFAPVEVPETLQKVNVYDYMNEDNDDD